jgi:hypothetical protein
MKKKATEFDLVIHSSLSLLVESGFFCSELEDSLSEKNKLKHVRSHCSISQLFKRP